MKDTLHSEGTLRGEAIFEFNHIEKNLTEDQILTLKDFYKHYHKKFWCLKKFFEKFQSLDQIITSFGICLVIIRIITGGITLNPIILGVVNGIGLLISSIGKMKNYKKKIEMTKIAFTTYEKVLVELRSALRGNEFDKDEFLGKMKVIDEMIIDHTPPMKYEKIYKQKILIIL